MSHAQRLSQGDTPVSYMLRAGHQLQDAMTLKKYEKATRTSADKKTLYFDLGTLSLDIEDKQTLNCDDLTAWLTANGITYTLSHATYPHHPDNEHITINKETIIANYTADTRSTYFSSRVEIKGERDIRKLAVAGFKFEGADQLRAYNDHLFQLASAKGSQRASPAG